MAAYLAKGLRHWCCQDCLSSGKPLLIDNIEEELDPILDPVLEKRFIRQPRGLTLQLNDKEARASHRASSVYAILVEQLHVKCLHGAPVQGVLLISWLEINISSQET